MSVRRTATQILMATALAIAFAVAGCSSKATSVRQEKARALAAAAPQPTVASAAKASEHFSKPAPRDPVFAKYADPDYGVAFRYPRNFALIESTDSDTDGDGDPESDRVISWQQAKQAGSGVRTAEELSADDPGAELLATVVVPEDAYPNTSFAGASLQFAVNRYQTAGSCRASLLSRLGDAKAPSGTVAAQGVTFAWIDIDAGDGSTEFYERDYAGYANGACYEFFVRVGVGASPAEQTLQSPSTGGASLDASNSISRSESVCYRSPNERKILSQLEKIVVSLQVEPIAVSSLDQPKYKASSAFGTSN